MAFFGRGRQPTAAAARIFAGQAKRIHRRDVSFEGGFAEPVDAFFAIFVDIDPELVHGRHVAGLSRLSERDSTLDSYLVPRSHQPP